MQIDLIPGAGVWPSHDWDGKPFSPSHYPRWHKLAGSELAGGWRGILDGIQGDQDFLHKVFHFKRFMAKPCDFVCLLQILSFRTSVLGKPLLLKLKYLEVPFQKF